MKRRMAPGIVKILDRPDNKSSNLELINREYKGPKLGRLFAAIQFTDAARPQIDDLKHMLEGTEVKYLPLLDGPIPGRELIKVDAEFARHHVVEAMSSGAVPVLNAVVLDLESIPAIGRTGFTCATFGKGRAAISGSGLVASVPFGISERAIFEDGQCGGFAVPNKLTGNNIIDIELPVDDQLRTVASITF